MGGTDSERLFCHLLGEVHRAGMHPLDTPAKWHWLHEQLLSLNRLGKLNCLLTDGQRLYCYRDNRGWKGLAFCQVFLMAANPTSFADPMVRVQVEGHPLNRGVAIATQPLSAQGWRSLELGQLMVLENGMACYTSPHIASVAQTV